MSAEVIYEEAVPVGLKTSSSINGCPTSGLIYADGLPVVIGRSINGALMLPVRKPASYHRETDHDDRFHAAAMEDRQPEIAAESETVLDEEYSNIRDLCADVDSIGMASDSSHNSSHIDPAEEYVTERRSKKDRKIEGGSSSGETWNERLLRQLLKKQNEHRTSTSSPSSSSQADDDGGRHRRKSKVKVSEGSSPGLMNSRNSIGYIVSGSLSRLFGKLSSTVSGREGVDEGGRARRRRGADGRSEATVHRDTHGIITDTDNGANIGDELGEDRCPDHEAPPTPTSDDDDFFWSDTEFDTDDIYANVGELHSANFELNGNETPLDDQLADQVKLTTPEDTVFHNELFQSRNIESDNERVNDDPETTSQKDFASGKLTLKIKQLRSLMDRKGVDSAKSKSDAASESKTPMKSSSSVSSLSTSGQTEDRDRKLSDQQRPEEKSVSGDTEKITAGELGHRQGDVKAALTKLIAERNAGVSGSNLRRPSMLNIPSADYVENESVQGVKQNTLGAKRNLLTSQIASLQERRRSVPVGIVFGSRPLTSVADDDGWSEDNGTWKHGVRIETKETRKPPTREKKFKLGPQVSALSSSTYVSMLNGLERSVPRPPRGEVDERPPLPLRDNKTANLPHQHSPKVSNDSNKHFEDRPTIPPRRGGSSNGNSSCWKSESASVFQDQDEYTQPIEMRSDFISDSLPITSDTVYELETDVAGQYTRNGCYDNEDDAEYENPDAQLSAFRNPPPPVPRSNPGVMTSPNNVGRPIPMPHPAPRSGRRPSIDDVSISDLGNSSNGDQQRPAVKPKPVPVGGKAIIAGVRGSTIGRVIDQLRPVGRGVTGVKGSPNIVSKSQPTVPEFDEEANLQQYVWYFGDTPRSKCEAKLVSLGSNGAFVVRRSNHGGPTSPYALTILHCGLNYNLLIRRKPDNKYAVGSEKADEHVFNNIVELVSFHHNNPLQLINNKSEIIAKVKLGASPKK